MPERKSPEKKPVKKQRRITHQLFDSLFKHAATAAQIVNANIIFIVRRDHFA
jgi:hypothetical protein